MGFGRWIFLRAPRPVTVDRETVGSSWPFPVSSVRWFFHRRVVGRSAEQLLVTQGGDNSTVTYWGTGWPHSPCGTKTVVVLGA